MSAVLSPIINLINITQDAVAVYDQGFNQVFPKARALKATIKPDKKAMEHPLENGATTTDHVVILPVEIELSMMLVKEDYRDTYNNIIQYYTNSTLLIVQTKASTYFNQFIVSPPHEEATDQFNQIAIAIKLKEVLFFTSQNKVVPVNPSNNSTVNRGNIQPQNVPAQKGSSVARDITKLFGG
jgi:hypothetical protein